MRYILLKRWFIIDPESKKYIHTIWRSSNLIMLKEEGTGKTLYNGFHGCEYTRQDKQVWACLIYIISVGYKVYELCMGLWWWSWGKEDGYWSVLHLSMTTDGDCNWGVISVFVSS